MYLALLNDQEKEMFLGLAYDLASADGNYSEEEKAVMNGYSQEMMFQFDIETMIKPFESLMKEFKEKSSERVKRIVIFELIGLAMTDGNYDEYERTLISKLEKEFDIGVGFAQKCEDVLNEYIAFQGKLNQLIIE